MGNINFIFSLYCLIQNEEFVEEEEITYRVGGVMDDTAEKAYSLVSRSSDEEFSTNLFNDAVR